MRKGKRNTLKPFMKSIIDSMNREMDKARYTDIPKSERNGKSYDEVQKMRREKADGIPIQS